MAAFHLLIAGRVQGVGYRAALADTAQALGLSGWVRNLRDGRVEAEIHGPAGPCEALVAWARRGPPSARVSSVDVTPCPTGTSAPPSFEILPTA